MIKDFRYLEEFWGQNFAIWSLECKTLAKTRRKSYRSQKNLSQIVSGEIRATAVVPWVQGVLAKRPTPQCQSQCCSAGQEEKKKDSGILALGFCAIKVLFLSSNIGIFWMYSTWKLINWNKMSPKWHLLCRLIWLRILKGLCVCNLCWYWSAQRKVNTWPNCTHTCGNKHVAIIQFICE